LLDLAHLLELPLIVMPAKAGIQVAGSDAQQAWIPAFAGMTAL
jgi:hypothetical protein